MYETQESLCSGMVRAGDVSSQTIRDPGSFYRSTQRFQASHEKLIIDLAGAYSRRINIQHRLVYQVLDEERIVKIPHLWSHYE